MVREIVNNLIGEEYRTAILIGIASVPFTVGINWAFVNGNVDMLPLFVACVVSGYLHYSDGMHRGIVTAFAGGVPVLIWQIGVVVGDWWGNPILVDTVGSSWQMGAASVGAALLSIGVGVILLFVIGAVAGGLGKWIYYQFDDSRRFQTEA